MEKRTNHAGDCTIYAAMMNGSPEDGICTCGYAHDHKADQSGDWPERAYSEERLNDMKKEWVGKIAQSGLTVEGYERLMHTNHEANNPLTAGFEIVDEG